MSESTDSSDTAQVDAITWGFQFAVESNHG
jgi:hypothetical protein